MNYNDSEDMMCHITNGDEIWLAEVARAACLRLNEEEAVLLAKDVGRELSELADLRPENAEENWKHGAVELSALREDLPMACLPREQLLSAASDCKDGCFLVPRVLGDGGEDS